MIRENVRVQHLCLFFVVANVICVADAASQLRDLMLAALAAVTALGCYVVGRASLDGQRVVWLRDGLIGLWAQVGLLLASTVVLLLGPEAVAHFRWLFIALGGGVGVLIKAIQR